MKTHAQSLSCPLFSHFSSLPIVLAIDSAEALKGPTKYLDSNARPLPASRLSLPSLLQSYVDGPKKVKHGAVIAAMDKSAPSAAPDTDVSVQVGPLSRTEAAGIFEHLADIKMLHQGETSVSKHAPGECIALIGPSF